MTNLIEPTDPLYFKETSSAPYDRHKYKLVFKNRKAIIFEDWDLARGAWFEWSQTGCLTTIEVLDSGGGKGFS